MGIQACRNSWGIVALLVSVLLLIACRRDISDSEGYVALVEDRYSELELGLSELELQVSELEGIASEFYDLESRVEELEWQIDSH